MSRLRGIVLLAFLVISASAFAEFVPIDSLNRSNFFNRGVNNLFNNRGFNRNFSFDLTFNFPQVVPGLSRIRVNKNNKNGTSVFVSDPSSGFVNRESVLAFDPFSQNFRIFTRATDPFGRPLSNFSRGGLDSEASRQVITAFLQNPKLGDFNNLEKAINGQTDFTGAFAANQIAAQDAGPDLTRGILRIQCDKDFNGQPTDLLAGQMNTDPASKFKPNPAYLKMNWVDRCKKLMSYTLNYMVDPFHPPINPNQFSVDPNTGVLTVSGLRQNFSLRNLAILFGRSNNPDVCNTDAFTANPVWNTEGIIRRSADPNIYNLVKGYDPDDVNRNVFVTAGVSTNLPNQLLGRIGANRTDSYVIDNRQSGVATSNQARKVDMFNLANRVQYSITYDSNDRASGNDLRSQESRQTGINNVPYRQSESFMYDSFGRKHALLSGAPDENGRVKIATEAPATAAHAGGREGAVTNGIKCLECHYNGPAIFERRGGPYDNVALNGTSGLPNLSTNASLIRNKFLAFLKRTDSYVENAEKPGSALPLPWDALLNAERPKSQAYVAAKLGYPPEVLMSTLRRNPHLLSQLQADKNGNLDAKNLEAGGKCLIKRILGDPRKYYAAAPASQPPLRAGRNGVSQQVPSSPSDATVHRN